MSVSYENICNLLSQKGLKKENLCEKVGISPEVLSEIGENESVPTETLVKICVFLGCTLDDLICDTSEHIIISPLPEFKFSKYDLFDLEIADEFENIGLRTLKDFPKPHTVRNLRKTLVKYIEESKLSIEAVRSLLVVLQQHNIIIDIDEGVCPDPLKLPKRFSNENEESVIYKTEHQQAENYIKWKLKQNNKEDCFAKYIAEEKSDVNTDVSELVKAKYIDDKVVYMAVIDEVNQNSYYPFNLLFDIFGNIRGYNYSFRYQYAFICNRVEEVLLSLSTLERFVIKSIYRYNVSLGDVIKLLSLPNNVVIKKVFKELFLNKALRKLRHPSRSKNLRNFIILVDKGFINLSNLKWQWRLEQDVIKSICDLIDFDYILGVYVSEMTCMNTTLLIIETLKNDVIKTDCFSQDIFGNIIKIDVSSSDEKLILNGVKTIGLNTKKFLEKSCKIIVIDDLNFSCRTENCLKKSNKNYLGDILNMTEEDFMKIKNFGKKSLDEVVEKAKDYGYSFNKSGVFEHTGLAFSEILNVSDFSKHYSILYNENKKEYEELLKECFFERCESLGFSLNGADWFIDMLHNTEYSLNDIAVIDKINNVQLLGSIILKKWRHVTHWTCESLLSEKNRLWFIVAFNRLYQVSLNEKQTNQI